MLVCALLCACLVLPSAVDGCSVAENWEPWADDRIIQNQKIVVYGRAGELFQPNKSPYCDDDYSRWDPDCQKSMRLSVFCVLKNDIGAPIASSIVIEEAESYESLCRVTQLEDGQDYIVGIIPQQSGTFKYDSQAPMQSAAFNVPEGQAAANDFVLDMMRLSGSGSAVPPAGRARTEEPHCPVTAPVVGLENILQKHIIYFDISIHVDP